MGLQNGQALRRRTGWGLRAERKAMEPASEQVLMLAPAAGPPFELDARWMMVGRGWREPATLLVQSDPALASRITVVTDPEDPDLDHGLRLGIRVQVRPDVVRRLARQVCVLSQAEPRGAGDSELADAASTDPVEAARALAIDATRRLLLARGLSRREAQVAAIAAEGDGNAEIAAELFLSPNTVKRHLRSAYRKLGVRQRTGLLALVHAALPSAMP